MQHSLENFKCHGCNERFDHYSTEVQFVTIPTLENGISYKRHFCLKCVNTKSSHPIPRFNYPSLPNQPVFGVHEGINILTSFLIFPPKLIKVKLCYNNSPIVPIFWTVWKLKVTLGMLKLLTGKFKPFLIIIYNSIIIIIIIIIII